jgi:hypothetical protein
MGGKGDTPVTEGPRIPISTPPAAVSRPGPSDFDLFAKVPLGGVGPCFLRRGPWESADPQMPRTVGSHAWCFLARLGAWRLSSSRIKFGWVPRTPWVASGSRAVPPGVASGVPTARAAIAYGAPDLRIGIKAQG